MPSTIGLLCELTCVTNDDAELPTTCVAFGMFDAPFVVGLATDDTEDTAVVQFPWLERGRLLVLVALSEYLGFLPDTVLTILHYSRKSFMTEDRWLRINGSTDL